MKNTQNQTCALGSSHTTAPRAATSGYHFKMTTGALSPAAKAAISQQQQVLSFTQFYQFITFCQNIRTFGNTIFASESRMDLWRTLMNHPLFDFICF